MATVVTFSGMTRHLDRIERIAAGGGEAARSPKPRPPIVRLRKVCAGKGGAIGRLRASRIREISSITWAAASRSLSAGAARHGHRLIERHPPEADLGLLDPLTGLDHALHSVRGHQLHWIEARNIGGITSGGEGKIGGDTREVADRDNLAIVDAGWLTAVRKLFRAATV